MGKIIPMFDDSNTVIMPTIVLCHRNKNNIGTIFPYSEFEITVDMAHTYELSFKVYKEVDGIENPLWDEITDLRVIYIPEYKEYFQISINEQETNYLVKTINAKNLGVAETSQTILYDIEINTEEDIKRDAYEVAYFWTTDETKYKTTLLGRLLDKMPHYSVKHVDASLINIVRQFSISNSSVYDTLTNTIAEEVNCLFHVDSDRTISVYDLEDYCPECGKRKEDMGDKCPYCGNTNIRYGYGKETPLYISTDNIASDIQVETNDDEIKNTFRIEGGDELITATIRAVNPNGSQYINRFSSETLHDMSDELQARLSEYDDRYNELQDEYADVMEHIYQLYDDIIYLQSGMSPAPVEKSLDDEVEIIEENVTNISVQTLRLTGVTTVNNAIKTYANSLLDVGYKATIQSNETYNTGDTVWKGVIRIEYEYADDDAEEEEKYKDTTTLTISIDEDYENFVKQKIEKIASKQAVEDLPNITDEEAFEQALTQYSLNRLSSFSDAYQSCLDCLIEIGNNEKTNEFYESIYVPYFNRKLKIDAEIIVREQQIDEKQTELDGYNVRKTEIQTELNIESWLGEELYLEYCSFRREDTYSNDNYISDGLNNAQLIQKAKDLFEVAQEDLYKASETQYTINTTIGNIFAIEEFENIKSQFYPGNFVRIYSDNKTFKVRILDFTIKDTDYTNLPVTLSNVTKIYNGITDISSVLDSAKSMASSYSSVARQAKKSEDTGDIIESWIDKGLNATQVAITTSDNQEVIIDNHGLLGKQWDDITESYEPEQVKLVNNVLAFTDDNWETVKTALGKVYYANPENPDELISAYGLLAEVVVGKLILGEALGIYNDGGSLQFDENGLVITNGINTLTVNPNDTNQLFRLTKRVDGKTTTILYVNSDGDGYFRGNIYAENGTFNGTVNATDGTFNGTITTGNGTIGGWKITATDIYDNSSSNSAGIGKYGTSPAFWAGGTYANRNDFSKTNFMVTHDGVLKAKNCDIVGSINFKDAITCGCPTSTTGDMWIDWTVINTKLTDLGDVRLDFNGSNGTILQSGNRVYGEFSGVVFPKHTVLFAQSVFFLKNITVDGNTYLASSPIIGSDRDIKNDIESLDKDASAEFIYSLNPVEYKYNDGTSNRFHHGFIAQEVNEAMGENDWGVYVDKNYDTGEKGGKAIRYEELIADLIATVQSQNERIAELEQAINELKTK